MDDPWARVVAAATEDQEAIAVLLHGSAARGEPDARDVVADRQRILALIDVVERHAVHQYGRLDDRRVHQHARKAPATLRRLTHALRACLGGSPARA